MEFDKYHWVDLNAPKKKEYTFRELKSESSNVPSEPQKKQEKIRFLEWSLYDFIIRKQRKLLAEAQQRKQTGQGKPTGFSDEEWSSFTQSGQWQTFRKQAMMLSSFLSSSKEEIEKAIQNLEKIFRKLGETSGNIKEGDDPVEIGFKKLNEIGEELMKSNIDSVNPKITQENFIQLIQDKWGNIEDSNLSTEIMDDTNLFMDMILTRKNRKFANLITQKNVTLGEAITLAFKNVSKKDPSKVEKVLQIFEEIVKRDSYTKGIGQTNVGKAEIAFAMFFGDCKLPEHGDIQMGNKLIEIKGAGGTITPRMGQRSWLAQGGDKSASWKKYQDRIRSKNEVKTMLSQIGITPNDLEFSNISEVIAKIEKAKRKQKNMIGKLESLKFAVIFAIMFNNYVTKEKISCFWLFNTAKDKRTQSLRYLFSTPIIQIDMGGSMWDNAFKFLNNPNVNLIYKSRENNSGYTFSIDFT